MSISINIFCFVIGVILFVVGAIAFNSDSLFFNIFGTFLLLISLSFCVGAVFDVREKNAQNQSTQYSQVQEETTPNVNENYNYNYNYNCDEGETSTTYNVQTITEPCTCSNCLKERNTIPTTTAPNTKCTCSNCVGQ